jgi:hypothetical protein
VGVNDKRAKAGESLYSCTRGKTPEGRTPDVAVGRNKPTRQKVEKIVEVERNGEGETKRAWETRGQWTPAAEVAKGDETPRKAPGAEAKGRLKTEYSGGESKCKGG